MKAIGIAILAGVGYFAYKNRATLLGGHPALPVAAPPITTPPGATVPIRPPGMTLPSPCTSTSSDLLNKALAWRNGHDTSQASLLGLIRNTAPACRPGMGTALKMVGVAISVVDNALRAVG